MLTCTHKVPSLRPLAFDLLSGHQDFGCQRSTRSDRWARKVVATRGKSENWGPKRRPGEGRNINDMMIITGVAYWWRGGALAPQIKLNHD